MTKKLLSIIVLMVLLLNTTLLPAEARHKHNRDCDHNRNRQESTTRTVLKNALIGAGAGALIGGIANRDNRNRGIVQGALIGGVLGGGYGYVKNRGVFQNNRNVMYQYGPPYGNAYGVRGRIQRQPSYFVDPYGRVQYVQNAPGYWGY